MPYFWHPVAASLLRRVLLQRDSAGGASHSEAATTAGKRNVGPKWVDDESTN